MIIITVCIIICVIYLPIADRDPVLNVTVAVWPGASDPAIISTHILTGPSPSPTFGNGVPMLTVTPEIRNIFKIVVQLLFVYSVSRD